MKKLLLYNLDNQKGREIECLCKKLNIEYKHIPAADYLEHIGTLAALSGFNRIGLPFTGIPFPDEIILFQNFDSSSLNLFLDKYRSAGIPSVPLKAGLTPTNIHWNSLQLHKELKNESRAMEQLNMNRP